MSFSGPFTFALLITSFVIVISVEDIPVPGGNTTTTTNSPYTTTTPTTSTTPGPSPHPNFGHYITIRFNSIKKSDSGTIVDDDVIIEHDGIVEPYRCYPTFHWRLVYFIDQFIYHNTSHISCVTQPNVKHIDDCSCTCFDALTNKFVQIFL